MTGRQLQAGVSQEVAQVVATRRAGAYQHLTLRAPGIAGLARPGQFVALAVGGESSGMLLRRSFSIHRVDPGGAAGRAGGGTVEIVVSDVGAGTRWIVERAPHDAIDVVGPLGTPFPMPSGPVACVLVGGGYGSAPLSWLAGVLRERGCHVEMVLGAASEDRLFGVAQARSLSHVIWTYGPTPGASHWTSRGQANRPTTRSSRPLTDTSELNASISTGS